MVRHPFIESKRAYVCPYKVEKLHKLYWGGKDGTCQITPTLHERRDATRRALSVIRPDIKRELNPTPYKVSVTDEMYHFLHNLMLQNSPIGELS